MLVHSNTVNICTFSTQFSTRSQTIQDVCTERNELNKNSIFMTIWSSYFSSQKLVLQLPQNITTLFHVSLSSITRNILLLLIDNINSNNIVSKLFGLLQFLLVLILKTNTLCCVVII